MQLDKGKIENCMSAAGIATHRELAERMGISRESLSRFISGVYNPSWETMESMCRVLGCRVDDLVVYDRPKEAALATM